MPKKHEILIFGPIASFKTHMGILKTIHKTRNSAPWEMSFILHLYDTPLPETSIWIIVCLFMEPGETEDLVKDKPESGKWIAITFRAESTLWWWLGGCAPPVLLYFAMMNFTWTKIIFLVIIMDSDFSKSSHRILEFVHENIRENTQAGQLSFSRERESYSKHRPC